MVISAEQAMVFYGTAAYSKLNEYLDQNDHSMLFIIVDSNTQNLCLPNFLQVLETNISMEVIEMEAGEEFKNIETCTGIWNVLSELGADRKSLIINLGGGVVTDLGGFVASTFKRGISYINVPTTLLSMVDASSGGKTGIDLGILKNQVGVISQPEMVLIDPFYLESLPPAEMRSGLAEILKHGLIASEKYWNKILSLNQLIKEDLQELIEESVEIKRAIVTQDPREENIRKTLNYGHTFGHAIESYFLNHPTKQKLLHGEAVAAGIIIAGFLSTRLCEFPIKDQEIICEFIIGLYAVINIDREDFEPIIDLLKYDKKNSHGNINFVLLKRIGDPVIDCKVPESLLRDGLEYYTNLKNS